MRCEGGSYSCAGPCTILRIFALWGILSPIWILPGGALVLAGEAGEGTAIPGEEGTETEAPPQATACERCNSTGRLTCPTCKGQGNIRKPCPICAGKGRRPCPICAVADAATGRQATPGRIPCPGCNGKGVLDGATDRPCFRCKGVREMPCPLCFGKGDLSCPKDRFEKTCPTCGFAGSIPCPDCQPGKKTWAGQRGRSGKTDPLPERGSASREPEEDPSEEDSQTVPKARSRGNGYTDGSYFADREEVETLWQEFEQGYLDAHKVLTGDTGSGIEKLRGNLTKLHRTVSEGVQEGKPGGADLLKAIQECRSRIEAMRRSWGDLGDRFTELVKQEGRIQAKMKDPPIWRPNLRPADREAVQDELAMVRRMLVSADKTLNSLKIEPPDRFGKELKEVADSLEEFQKSLRDLQTVQAKAAAKPKSPRNGPAGTGSGVSKVSRTPGESARSDPVPSPRSSEARNSRSPDDASKANGPSEDLSDGAANPDGAGEQRSIPADPGSRRSGDLLAIALGMLGLALCGGLFYMLHMKDAHRRGPEDG